MRFHAFAFRSGKENSLAETALVSHETLDCDSRKWESLRCYTTEKASGTATFRGPFFFPGLLLCGVDEAGQASVCSALLSA
jgi:hypothetical protein